MGDTSFNTSSNTNLLNRRLVTNFPPRFNQLRTPTSRRTDMWPSVNDGDVRNNIHSHDATISSPKSRHPALRAFVELCYRTKRSVDHSSPHSKFKWVSPILFICNFSALVTFLYMKTYFYDILAAFGCFTCSPSALSISPHLDDPSISCLSFSVWFPCPRLHL